MGTMLNLICLPVVDLGHPPYPSTSKTWVLVAVPPAIHRSLNEPTLAPQAWVELSQSPAYGIAFAFVVKAISLVLIFGTARTGVDTVLRLEVLRETVDIHRFNIASDGVLHLNPVSGIFKSDPLHAILVLPDNERCGCWNWSGSSIGINSR